MESGVVQAARDFPPSGAEHRGVVGHVEGAFGAGGRDDRERLFLRIDALDVALDPPGIWTFAAFFASWAPAESRPKRESAVPASSRLSVRRMVACLR